MKNVKSKAASLVEKLKNELKRTHSLIKDLNIEGKIKKVLLVTFSKMLRAISYIQAAVSSTFYMSSIWKYLSSLIGSCLYLKRIYKKTPPLRNLGKLFISLDIRGMIYNIIKLTESVIKSIVLELESRKIEKKIETNTSKEGSLPQSESLKEKVRKKIDNLVFLLKKNLEQFKNFGNFNMREKIRISILSIIKAYLIFRASKSSYEILKNLKNFKQTILNFRELYNVVIMSSGINLPKNINKILSTVYAISKMINKLLDPLISLKLLKVLS